MEHFRGTARIVMSKRTAIGIDLGCTNIKTVLIDDRGEILFEDRRETNERDQEQWKQSIRALISNVKKKSSIIAIGLCAPGLADAGNTCISFMPGRLPGLENFNWSDFIGEKIFVLNDAHSALTAEASFGAAKGLQHAI